MFELREGRSVESDSIKEISDLKDAGGQGPNENVSIVCCMVTLPGLIIWTFLLHFTEKGPKNCELYGKGFVGNEHLKRHLKFDHLCDESHQFELNSNKNGGTRLVQFVFLQIGSDIHKIYKRNNRKRYFYQIIKLGSICWWTFSLCFLNKSTQFDLDLHLWQSVYSLTWLNYRYRLGTG